MKTALELLAEAGLVIVHFPSNLLKPFINFNSINKNPTQKNPVILVERWFTRNPFHIVAKKYLENKGFTVYSLNSTLARGSFQDAARKVGNLIEKEKLSNVILVGISAGASTCLEYLEHQNGWQNTNTFISIGGSLKGSPLASLLPFLKSIQQLNPKSTYQKTLHNRKLKNLDKIVTLRAKIDSMVPEEYSHLEGTRNQIIDVAGHNLLHTFWIPTYRQVVKLAQEK